MDNILGVTNDGYIALNEKIGDDVVEFWDPKRGIRSGVMHHPGPGSALLKDLSNGPTLTFGFNIMPQRLDTTGQVWFDTLCRTDGRGMSENEKAQIPNDATTNPCKI
jgi:hypothetical protein